MTFIEKSQPRESDLLGEYPRDDFRIGLSLDIGSIADLARIASKDADEWVAQLGAKSLPTLVADLSALENSFRHALVVIRATSVRASDHMSGKTRL